MCEFMSMNMIRLCVCARMTECVCVISGYVCGAHVYAYMCVHDCCSCVRAIACVRVSICVNVYALACVAVYGGVCRTVSVF